MTDFSHWMKQLENDVSNISEVAPGKIDSSLQAVHALLQEHSEKQPTFSALYAEVKILLSSSAPEETSEIGEMYSALVANYQVKH